MATVTRSGYLFIAPDAASTPRPMTPPRRTFPAAMDSVLEGIMLDAVRKHSFVQLIGSAADCLSSATLPGVVKPLGPLGVWIVQDAPGTPGVSTAIVWVVPLVIVAQPTRTSASASTTSFRIESPKPAPIQAQPGGAINKELYQDEASFH